MIGIFSLKDFTCRNRSSKSMESIVNAYCKYLSIEFCEKFSVVVDIDVSILGIFETIS